MNNYYFSWTAQNNSVDFPVASSCDDYFVLADGRQIYDFISTSFQTNFGHRNRQIITSITEQLNHLPIASPKSHFDLKESVSERLNQFIDRGTGKIFYTVSGAEAVENALKIARQITSRKIVLARQKSYHGASLGALSVTGDWRNEPHLTFDEGTVRIPDHNEDPDLAKTKAIIEQTGPEQIAAVILETISGTNGMSIPSKEWFAGIQTICRQHGIMLIIDEVLVGFGRCGSNFAFHDYDLDPDLVCMSKAISGGYIPFGAVWTSSEIANHYDQNVLACGLTNYGHPLGLAALNAILDLLHDKSFLEVKQQNENRLGEFLNELKDRVDTIQETRHRGMMGAIYFTEHAPSWQTAFDHGLHLFSKNNLVILAPPYNTGATRFNDSLQKFAHLCEQKSQS